MREFVRRAAWTSRSGACALAAGSPGVAVSLDLEAYDKRRAAMLALLKVAAGARAVRRVGAGFAKPSAAARARSWICYLKVLYDLLRDLLVLHEGAGEIRNQDIRRELEALAAKVEFAWIRKAVAQVDEIAQPDPPQHSEDRSRSMR